MRETATCTAFCHQLCMDFVLWYNMKTPQSRSVQSIVAEVHAAPLCLLKLASSQPLSPYGSFNPLGGRDEKEVLGFPGLSYGLFQQKLVEKNGMPRLHVLYVCNTYYLRHVHRGGPGREQDCVCLYACMLANVPLLDL